MSAETKVRWLSGPDAGAASGQDGAAPYLVEVSLQHGRRHQVRAHLAYLGAPVVGDHIYADGVKSVDDAHGDDVDVDASDASDAGVDAAVETSGDAAVDAASAGNPPPTPQPATAAPTPTAGEPTGFCCTPRPWNLNTRAKPTKSKPRARLGRDI